MASVQNSRASKYARLAVGDEPKEHLESVGDCLIKELAEKQTDTKLTLEKQFQQEKQFQKGTGFVTLSSFSAGTSSLDDFQKKTKDAERLEQLTARGLTLNEAKRYISGQDLLYSSKAEYSAQKSQQVLVRQCLEDEIKDNQNTDASRLSRQERESLSVKPNSVETQLLQFALSCKKPAKVDLRPAAHPINNLIEIEKGLFKEHVDPLVLAKTVNRKRRQQLDALLPPQLVRTKPVTSKGSSLWDVINKPVIVENRKPMETKVYGCVKQRLFTVKDGKIIEVGGKQQTSYESSTKMNEVEKVRDNCDGQPFVTVGEIIENNLQNGKRFSESEIREIPKFKNYERGKLNKTLYLKNIASTVKEDDLLAIFSRFQDPESPKLIYRLMKGKMRGQAFISFPNSVTAAKALDCVNGLVLKGKPLIIQFGKESYG